MRLYFILILLYFICIQRICSHSAPLQGWGYFVCYQDFLNISMCHLEKGKVRKLLHSAQNLSFLNCQVFKFIALGFPTPYPHFLLVFVILLLLISIREEKLGVPFKPCVDLKVLHAVFWKMYSRDFSPALGQG